MIKRFLAIKLEKDANKHPVIALLGPRQSGKTTLVKSCFNHKEYVSLEQPHEKEFALNDPLGFLSRFPEGAIIDEAQNVPSLFSYIQAIVDEKKKNGFFILTGSQNFLLMENVSQTLAGRVALHTLMPFTYSELKSSFPDTSLNNLMFTGGYPRIYDQRLNPSDWLSDYIRTYIERDVRLIKNITDLTSFHRFLKMCAARSGQLLNLSSLGDDCGITHNTAKSWLSLLESSYLVFLHRPYYRNFDKRIKKSPKLYFYDVGLLCHLLGVSDAKTLETHSKRGALFETWVIAELMKQKHHQKAFYEFFFWQDKSKKEIDCLIEKGDKKCACEIKAGMTVTPDYYKNLRYWLQVSKAVENETCLVYAGDSSFKREGVMTYSWKDIERLPVGV